MAPRRRLLAPDYAGAIRNGINENLNGTRTSSNNFSTPMGGGISNKQYSELIGRQRQAEAATPGTRDRYNPNTPQAVIDTIGFGNDASGNFQVNPLALAGILPIGRIFGGAGRVVSNIARAVVPKATRIASAAARVSERAAMLNRAKIAAARVARSEATDTFDRASGLRKPTFIGSDLYETSSRQVDALFDKWETSSYRVGQGGGPSAWQRAQDAAAATGRTVTRKAADGLGGTGLTGDTFLLRATSKELDLADQLDRGAGALVRKADDLARSVSPYANNPAAAASELKRRLNALKTVPVRREPFRKPRNPAL